MPLEILSDGEDEGECSKAVIPARPSSSGIFLSCAICGESAKHLHFGVLSCAACAAFFRRCVAQRKRYVCKRGGRCNLKRDDKNSIVCKYCRLQKCFRTGMHIPEVESVSRDPVDIADSPLHRLLCHWKARIYNRVVYTIHTYGGSQNVVHMANKERTGASVARAWLCEPWVLYEFLKSIGFTSYLPECITEEVLIKSILYRWITFENILNTARNMGFLTNTSFFCDESILQLKMEKVAEFYSTHAGVLNTDTAALISMDFYEEKQFVAKKFYEARFDETEQAVLAILSLIQCASGSFGKNVFKRLLGDLFEGLKKHYISNNVDIAVRMGDLILFIREIERVNRKWDELRSVLRLNCQTPDPNTSTSETREYASIAFERWELDKSKRTLVITI